MKMQIYIVNKTKLSLSSNQCTVVFLFVMKEIKGTYLELSSDIGSSIFTAKFFFFFFFFCNLIIKCEKSGLWKGAKPFSDHNNLLHNQWMNYASVAMNRLRWKNRKMKKKESLLRTALCLLFGTNGSSHMVFTMNLQLCVLGKMFLSIGSNQFHPPLNLKFLSWAIKLSRQKPLPEEKKNQPSKSKLRNMYQVNFVNCFICHELKQYHHKIVLNIINQNRQ